MKQAIVVRADLGMGTGKVAAQASHASLRAFEYADDRAQRAWKQGGQKKIVLKAGSERELYELSEEAKAAGLPSAVIEDAGHTQVEPGTPTALAIGPAAEADIDAITGDLSLF
ncbi:peptidyl-tRNA hydrolase Pth2 [Salarchaeum sp. JOR-1]|uniref:peptidyl-tRNA hydrolase Pth2 n=1 Tax=Salarchaeum sp. JOR-1 TaxID=2599399 RepID=UPI001198C7F8|nr:peptidyl-tRNA hydrolase Pth2 [Salarchaeum sp. JOR-1]QDX39812.1 peptidyl-tRNA hydrolase [Salarchaeum sp. JOR-1]